jgi:hypothetical protein
MNINKDENDEGIQLERREVGLSNNSLSKDKHNKK